jgi:hypothetical protein
MKALTHAGHNGCVPMPPEKRFLIPLDKPLRLASRQSTVVTAGRPAQVATMKFGDTEYKLFQTVEPLTGQKEQRT